MIGCDRRGDSIQNTAKTFFKNIGCNNRNGIFAASLWQYEIDDAWLSFAIGLLACAAVFVMAADCKEAWLLKIYDADISAAYAVCSAVQSTSAESYLLHYGVLALLTMMDSDMDSGIFVIISIAATVALAYALNRICIGYANRWQGYLENMED